MTDNTPITNREVPTSTELVVPESLPVPVDAPKVVHRSSSPLPWLVLGLGVGVIGTAAVFSARTPKAAPPVIQSSMVAQNTPSTSLGKEIVGLKPSPGAGAPETLASKPDAAVTGSGVLGAAIPGAPTAGGKAEPAPMNPFGGSAFVLPKLPVPKGGSGFNMSGMILPRNLPPIPTTPILPPAGKETGPKPGSRYLNDIMAKGLPKAPPALKPAKPGTAVAAKPGVKGGGSTLVTLNQLANNRQDAADELIAFVQKIGGKGQPLTEQGADSKPLVTGVLATVPEKAVPDLMRHVNESGAVVEKQTWSGSSSERRAKLSEDAQARIASLKKLREALLVTYLEDAEPVKDVDEEIAKATKSLDQLQTDKGSDSMAIIRISFVGK